MVKRLNAGARIKNLVEIVVFALIAMLLSVWLVKPGYAKTYYVAKNGSDGNSGSSSSPYKTIGKAIGKAYGGDSVMIRSGVYRETVSLQRSGSSGSPITICGKKGEEIKIKGSDVVTGWNSAGSNRWSKSWSSNSQQVFCDGKLLQQIGKKSNWHSVSFTDKNVLEPVGTNENDMTEGSFYYSDSKKKMYIRLPNDDDPSNHEIEISVRSEALRGNWKSHIQFFNVGFYHNSASAHADLLITEGSNWLMEDCKIMDGCFYGIGEVCKYSTFRRCVISGHGNAGVSITGNSQSMHMTFDACTLMHNNSRNFWWSWHAGAFKIIPRFREFTVKNCYVAENNGPGIWFDAGYGNVTIENNVVLNNAGPGIFYEISYPSSGDSFGAKIHNNLVVGSGRQGIYISAARGAEVTNNTVVNCWAGIVVHGMPREDYKLADNKVSRNIVGGCELQDFVKFEGSNTYGNEIDDNFYVPADNPNQTGESGRLRIAITKTTGYDGSHNNLQSVFDDYGYEKNGKTGDPGFADPSAYNFCPDKNGPAHGYGCTVTGDGVSIFSNLSSVPTWGVGSKLLPRTGTTSTAISWNVATRSPASLHIYTCKGQQVLSPLARISDNQTVWDVPHHRLSKGLYIAKAQAGSKMASCPFRVMK